MKTDELIHQLASQGVAVKPLNHPGIRFLQWSTGSLIFVGLGSLIIGHRSDLDGVIFKKIFLLQFGVMICLAFVSALSVFFLSVPDRPKKWPKILPVGALVLWSVSLGYLFSQASILESGWGIKCLRNITILSLFPGIAMLLMLKKAAILKIRWSGFWAILSVATLACSSTRFICPNDNPLHFFSWHYLPVIVLGLGGCFFGNFLFHEKNA